MNIYFCREKDEPYGLYIAAKTRGRAKAIYAAGINADYIDIQSNIIKGNVKEKYETEILEDSPLLKKYGLKYMTEEEYTGW